MGKIWIIELLRGFTALYVFMHHWIRYSTIDNKALKIIFAFGQEAVILFFLISGMVIFLSFEKSSCKTFHTYFQKRFSRIYPMFVFSILFSTAISILFMMEMPSIKAILGNLIMLQDRESLGYIVDPVAGNRPLWSISYEWWFYLLFYFLYKISQRDFSRYIIISAYITILSFFIHMLYPFQLFRFIFYLSIWNLGAYLAYHIYYKEKHDLKILSITIAPILIILTALLSYQIYEILITKNSFRTGGGFPIREIRHFGIGFLYFIIALIIAKATKKKLFQPDYNRNPSQLKKLTYYLASISFGIYLVHYPVIKVFEQFNLGFIEIIIVPVLVISLAHFMEHILQPKINHFFLSYSRP